MTYKSKTLRDDVRAKMIIEQIADLSDGELRRVFEACVAPEYCIQHVKRHIDNGLTIEQVYAK